MRAFDLFNVIHHICTHHWCCNCVSIAINYVAGSTSYATYYVFDLNAINVELNMSIWANLQCLEFRVNAYNPDQRSILKKVFHKRKGFEHKSTRNGRSTVLNCWQTNMFISITKTVYVMYVFTEMSMSTGCTKYHSIHQISDITQLSCMWLRNLLFWFFLSFWTD